MKYSIITALIVFLSVGKVCALNISSVTGAENKKDFEFSKTIFIKGVEFKNGFLKMPLDGYKKKKYSNIKILSKDFYQKISNCFNDEKCVKSGGKKDILIKIEKIFPLKSPLRVANANISFDDELIVVFGIVKSKERGQRQEVRSKKQQQQKKMGNEIWISYPKDFEIRNRVFKNDLEKLIKKEFLRTLKEKIR